MTRLEDRRNTDPSMRRESGTKSRGPSELDHAGRASAALLVQQCWLWGRDVRRAEGNLLVEYGFERAVPAQREWGSSCYTYVVPTGETVRLWSFGVMYSDEARGGVLLQKTSAVPLLVAPRYALAPAWRREHIATAREPRFPADARRMLSLFPSMLAWIGAYEQWVVDTLGADYRRDCIEACPDRCCDPTEIPAKWWEAAAHWREVLTS